MYFLMKGSRFQELKFVLLQQRNAKKVFVLILFDFWSFLMMLTLRVFECVHLENVCFSEREIERERKREKEIKEIQSTW